MKKVYLLLTLGFITAQSFAQLCNVVLFTEEGERFTVILNGARQNNNPETQVRITDLNSEFYKMKIIFDDQTLGSLDQTLYLVFGTERSYNIKRNKKGVFVTRMVSESPLAQLPPPAPNQQVIVYNPNPAPQPVTNVVVTETTTTSVGGSNVSMGVNMPGIGVNVNINDNSNIHGTSHTTTTHSTTTTTTSGQIVQPAPVQNVYVMPGYNGPVGCPWPMSAQDFQGVKGSISSKSFEDSKLTLAKQVINSNCLFSSQVKEIMLLFSFENTRLDLAKYAYGYTFDIGNYYKVNDAFTFESSIDDLNRHIGSYKR
ncbi:MAG: DUF4476 domain-containing protein [Bacteroidota bacterium]|nr:DUF4476 domain-containing protein [Bacteroidota bacterium]